MVTKTEKYILGYDIGGTKCAVILGIVENNNAVSCKIIDKETFPTQEKNGFNNVIEELFLRTEKILHKHHLTHVSINSVGVSCGGPLDSKEGIIMSPPNLPGWDQVPITNIIEQQLGIPAQLINDADAGAVAEWKFGAAKGYKNIVFLTFGTGMGAGLILNGQLYTGTNNMAGEVGHIRLSSTGPWGYGKNGSFEGFCSGGGIARMAKMQKDKFIASGGYSQLLKYNQNPSAKDLALALQDKDPFAMMVYEQCAEKLGQGLSILIDILNPECIIIGGIYARNEFFFRTHMLPVIKREALENSLSVCKIIPSSLGENIGDYAALGAAMV